MPDYELHVTKGAIRLSRTAANRLPKYEGKLRAAREKVAEAAHAPSGEDEQDEEADDEKAERKHIAFTSKARRAMRYMCSAMPWWMLGKRPMMFTMTYPADWRPWVKDAKQLARHRDALKKAWRRKYGDPIGIWVVEFQPRLRRPLEQRSAPHIHTYLRLPDCVSDEEYDGLVKRTLERKRLEMRYGKYRGRSKMKPPEGEFAEWLLSTWWRIVGSQDRYHRTRGIDITAVFWSDKAEGEATWERIADYFWRESGKVGQKTPPGNFGRVAFYGRWGKAQGFEPMEGVTSVEGRLYYRMRRPLERLQEQVSRRDAAKRGLPYRPTKFRRGRNGVTLFIPDAPTLAGRLRDWAVSEELSQVE